MKIRLMLVSVVSLLLLSSYIYMKPQGNEVRVYEISSPMFESAPTEPIYRGYDLKPDYDNTLIEKSIKGTSHSIEVTHEVTDGVDSEVIYTIHAHYFPDTQCGSFTKTTKSGEYSSTFNLATDQRNCEYTDYLTGAKDIPLGDIATQSEFMRELDKSVLYYADKLIECYGARADASDMLFTMSPVGEHVYYYTYSSGDILDVSDVFTLGHTGASISVYNISEHSPYLASIVSSPEQGSNLYEVLKIKITPDN